MEAAPVLYAVDEKVLVGYHQHQAYVARPVRAGDDTVLVRWESTGAREEVAVGVVKKINLDAKRPRRKRRDASAAQAEASAPAQREPPRKRRKKKDPLREQAATPARRQKTTKKSLREQIDQHVKALHSSDADGKKAAEEALEELANKDDANRTATAQLLVGLLSGGSAEDQAQAARVLAHLTCDAPAGTPYLRRAEFANRAAIREAGAIRPLVDLVRNGAAGGQAQAARALRWLAPNSAANQADFAAAGGVEALVALVRTGAVDGQNNAAWALANLADNNAANQAAIFAAGGIEALVAFAQTGDKASYQVSAAVALRNLAEFNAANCAAIAKELVALVVDGVSGYQEKAAGLLGNLAHDDANKAAIVAAGGVEALVALAMNGSELGKRIAQRALGGLPLADRFVKLQRRLDRYEGSGAIDVTQDDDADDDAQHRDTGLRDLRERKAQAQFVEVKKEKEALEDRVFCTICMEADAPRTVLFGPCNHFLACASCADELQECPNCRVPITARTSIANTS